MNISQTIIMLGMATMLLCISVILLGVRVLKLQWSMRRAYELLKINGEIQKLVVDTLMTHIKASKEAKKKK